jgi:predicted component of type VI protein secretion system
VRKKLILSDGTRDRELQLVGRIVVGRDPSCEVSHDDSLLSRRHAEFVTLGDDVTVRDLGSRNGVFVNGARSAEHRLEAGDVVQIGPLRARYVMDEAPATIVPEEMDEDRTAIFMGPIDLAISPAASKPVVSPAIVTSIPAFTDSVAEFDSEEEEVTRLVPAPRMPRPAPAASSGASVQSPAVPSAAAVADDEVTHFTRAPRFTIPAAIPPAPVPAAAPRRPVRVEAVAPASDPRGFVYLAVGILAFIVLASTAPLFATASTGALAIPVAVAVVGTVLVGSLINRRITRALAAVERKGT